MPASPTERRPNLFIIGAAKCGTTSLHAYLQRHPDVFMSDPKEPGYFVPEMDYYPKDLSWYLGLFAGAGDARVVGESSTHYTKIPVYSCVAEQVHAFSPEARIIYLTRDPIERAISHYWHNARQMQEARGIRRAIKEDIQYRAVGDYAMQLQPWLNVFDRTRIRVLVFEEMVADPEGTLGSVLDWLDLPALSSPLQLERQNSRPTVLKKARGRGIVNKFRYSKFWDAVSPTMPQGLKDWAKAFALETVRPGDEPVEEVVRHLRPWAQERIAALESLLDRRFDLWRTSLDRVAEEA